MPVPVDPALIGAAKSDPLLEGIIRRGEPLSREAWIRYAWGAAPPKPWCIEHEMEVPEFWQDADLVEAEEG
jgi:hypothetical protein